MDWDTMLSQANAELLTAEGDLRVARKRVDDLRKIVEGIKGLKPSQSSSEASTKSTAVEVGKVPPPKPKNAVLTAIQTKPRTPLAPKDVLAIVRELGLFDENLGSGATAYSTALSRLAEDDSVTILKDSEGRYTYYPKQADSPQIY